jgi:hypothetical protein
MPGWARFRCEFLSQVGSFYISKNILENRNIIFYENGDEFSKQVGAVVENVGKKLKKFIA